MHRDRGIDGLNLAGRILPAGIHELIAIVCRPTWIVARRFGLRLLSTTENAGAANYAEENIRFHESRYGR